MWLVGALTSGIYLASIVYVLVSDAPHWAKALTLTVAIGMGAVLKRPTP